MLTSSHMLNSNYLLKKSVPTEITASVLRVELQPSEFLLHVLDLGVQSEAGT